MGTASQCSAPASAEEPQFGRREARGSSRDSLSPSTEPTRGLSCLSRLQLSLQSIHRGLPCSLPPGTHPAPPAPASLRCCGEPPAARPRQTFTASITKAKWGFSGQTATSLSCFSRGVTVSLGTSTAPRISSSADAPGRLCRRLCTALAPTDTEPQAFAIKLLRFGVRAWQFTCSRVWTANKT